jgi:predicted metallo-beta-lactamase superfamily hydrolase
MKIEPLAFESLGVRSMATLVSTSDVTAGIDLAASLAPNRFGLPPHRIEKEILSSLLSKIRERASETEVMVVTHYHYDHVNPEQPDLFRDKLVLLKNPRRMINPSQRKRAASFLRDIRGLTKDVRYSDDNSFRFGDTTISFSRPVPHGSTASRGYVVEVCVRESEAFLYSSDVNGPALPEHLDFILEERPKILFLDGPTTYIDTGFVDIEIKRTNQNLRKIMEETEVEQIVLDHHLLRDLDYYKHLSTVHELGEELGIRICSAAEFLNVEPILLEARRRELYGKDGLQDVRGRRENPGDGEGSPGAKRDYGDSG